jgi:hypothetical protein
MQCIYCGSTKNLNTSLTVTLDDGIKHTVNICDEHAEEASIKSAKAAFMTKQAQIKEVIEQAKALGLNISETGSLALAESQPEPAPVESAPAEKQPKTIQQSSAEINPDDDDFIPTDVVDRSRPMTSVGGNTTMGNVQSYSSYDMSGTRGDLPEEVLKGKVKMEVMEGREGQPIALPQQRIDGTGTTSIHIAKTEDDRKLQERFKQMANESMGDKTPDFARSGYSNTTATCPICRGDAIVKMGAKSQICPKCNGSGFISIS